MLKRALLITLMLFFARTCSATYFIEGKDYGDKLTINEPNQLGFGYDDVSITVWIRSINTWAMIFNASDFYGYFEIYIASPNGTVQAKIASDEATEVSLLSTVPVFDGIWHLLAVTIDRDIYHGNRIWIDGNDVSYWAGDIRWLTDTNFNFNSYNKFARLLELATSSNYFQMDQFRLYKGKVLTQSEIQVIYNNRIGTPVIESQMESLLGFCYFEFEEGSGNPVGRQWNGSTWLNITTINNGLLWQFGGVDPWNQYERNGDCWINFIDFSIFAQDWLKTEPNLVSDFDFSGKVDINDLDLFVNYWLTGSQGIAPVVQDVNFSLNKNTSHSFDINATDTEQLIYSVESLPTKGQVYTSTGVHITSIPYILPNNTIRYDAGDYNNVNDSFNFAADDSTGFQPPCGGKVTRIATIFIIGIQPPGKATNPIPYYDATNVALDANLSWTTGAGAATHKIYLGEDANDPCYRGEQVATLYDPNFSFDYNTIYFWRIDENSPNGITTGDLWKFTTLPEQQPPPACSVEVSCYNWITVPIQLLPAEANYIITFLPENASLQDPCSGAGVIDGNMLPYTMSGTDGIIWFATESNSPSRLFKYRINQDVNDFNVCITVSEHPRDLLSFDGLGIVEFNDSNYCNLADGWAVDFWVRTKEPFTGLLNKRDVNQGWEIGITSGKPKFYVYDNNGNILLEARSFYRIDDDLWHEIVFNYNQDGNGVYIAYQSYPDYQESFTFSGNHPLIVNDCNLQFGFNSKQGYRGDLDMLRFFQGIDDPLSISNIIQGFLQRDGSGFESWMGFGRDSIVRYPMNEGSGLVIIDDKLGYTGTVQDPNHTRWYPFWFPFEDVSVQQYQRRN